MHAARMAQRRAFSLGTPRIVACGGKQQLSIFSRMDTSVEMGSHWKKTKRNPCDKCFRTEPRVKAARFEAVRSGAGSLRLRTAQLTFTGLWSRSHFYGVESSKSMGPWKLSPWRILAGRILVEKLAVPQASDSGEESSLYIRKNTGSQSAHALSPFGPPGRLSLSPSLSTSHPHPHSHSLMSVLICRYQR